MKKNIHPKYYLKAKAKCACGHVFTVGSTRENIEVEICSNCHPFYTGKEKLIDTAGKVEKFKARREKAKVTAKKIKKTEKRRKKVQKSIVVKKKIATKKVSPKKKAAPKTKPRKKK